VLLQPPFLGKQVAVVGDPAGIAKSNISEETSFDALKRLGFYGVPAPTNDIDPRIRAVEAWLLKQQDGAGGVLISRSGCPTLIRALGGAYRYGKTRSGVRKPKPEKSHPWSDVVDAFQYVCMVAHGRTGELVARHLAGRHAAPKRKPMSAGAWT
jgi:hypothetical protein